MRQTTIFVPIRRNINKSIRQKFRDLNASRGEARNSNKSSLIINPCLLGSSLRCRRGKGTKSSKLLIIPPHVLPCRAATGWGLILTPSSPGASPHCPQLSFLTVLHLTHQHALLGVKGRAGCGVIPDVILGLQPTSPDPTLTEGSSTIQLWWKGRVYQLPPELHQPWWWGKTKQHCNGS